MPIDLHHHVYEDEQALDRGLQPRHALFGSGTKPVIVLTPRRGTD
jgi:hypothetical protein